MLNFIHFSNRKEELEKIINDKASDKDMIELANSELSALISKNEKVKKTNYFSLPKDEADKKNAILEIRAGTGGLEASHLLQIYLKCMKNL